MGLMKKVIKYGPVVYPIVKKFIDKRRESNRKKGANNDRDFDKKEY